MIKKGIKHESERYTRDEAENMQRNSIAIGPTASNEKKERKKEK